MAKSFAVIADTHLECDDATTGRMNQGYDAFLAKFASEHETPDFVLVLGDVSQYATKYPLQFDCVRRHFDRLPCPWLAISGNHDLATRPDCRSSEPFEYFEDCDPEETEFARRLCTLGVTGAPANCGALRFSFRWQGLRLIGMSLRERDGADMMPWLRRELEQTAPEPVLLMSHYQLVPARADGPLKTWGFGRIHSLVPQLREIVAEHSQRIVAYLHGHTHATSLREDEHGVAHLSIGGLTTGALDYHIFEIDPAGLRYQTHDLPAGAGEPGFWNATDAEHPTDELYHKGVARERQGTLPLPQAMIE